MTGFFYSPTFSFQKEKALQRKTHKKIAPENRSDFLCCG